MDPELRVLELYSGIGGMHYALEESGLLASVVAAIDINEVANTVYRHNFPQSPLLQRNILSLTEGELNALQPNAIMMSPPCQPFTRVGLKKDVNDERTSSFMHLLQILPALNSVQYILVENVKGFETSEARNRLVSTLNSSGFFYQEFLLSPHNFSIPNTRHRYYLIAKRKPREFVFPVSLLLMTSLPLNSDYEFTTEAGRLLQEKCRMKTKHLEKKLFSAFGVTDEETNSQAFAVRHVLEDVDESEFLLSSKTLVKHAKLLDIVTPNSRRSCCFTKAYSHYVEGTGSVLCPCTEESVKCAYEKCVSLQPSSEEYVKILKDLRMRYFTPREVSRLMCFPESFAFPPSTTTKQKYRLLGNSINVHVVALLLVVLTSNIT